MTKLIHAFDATTVDPSQGLGQLPVGKHPVVIVDDEIKANSANDGGMAVLTVQIIDGPSKGQQGFYRLNLYNKSEKAAEIAHRQLSALCHVIGQYKIDDLRALHNTPFIIEVGLQKDPEAAAKGYTEIKRVFDINGNEPGKQAAGGQPAQPAQAAATGGGQSGWGQPQNAAPAQPQQAPQQGWGGGAPAGDKPSWAK